MIETRSLGLQRERERPTHTHTNCNNNDEPNKPFGYGIPTNLRTSTGRKVAATKVRWKVLFGNGKKKASAWLPVKAKGIFPVCRKQKSPRAQIVQSHVKVSASAKHLQIIFSSCTSIRQLFNLVELCEPLYVLVTFQFPHFPSEKKNR